MPVDHNRRANVLFGVGGGLLVLLIASAVIVRMLQPTYDPMTLCIEGRSSDGITAVLIDKTDPLTAQQREDVLRQIRSLAGAARRNEMIAIYTLHSREGGLLDPHFRCCSPGSEREANFLTENTIKAAEKFRTRFADPLDSLAHTLLEDESGDTSPILEGIREITRQPEFQSAAGRRRLWIISDLLQNVPEASYLHGLSVARLEASGHLAEIAVDLRGVEVEVFQIRRPRDYRHQTSALTEFWIGYLRRMGASIPSHAMHSFAAGRTAQTPSGSAARVDALLRLAGGAPRAGGDVDHAVAALPPPEIAAEEDSSSLADSGAVRTND